MATITQPFYSINLLLITHSNPDFDLGNADTILNDICILELDLDFDFNGNVSMIELNTNEVILDPTSSCTIAGGGMTHVSID